MTERSSLSLAFSHWLENQSQPALSTWFRTGIVGVAIDKRPPHESFSPGRHLIGRTDHRTWHEDVLGYLTGGTKQLKTRFESVLLECLGALPAFADEDSAAIQPELHAGLVDIYLWFARNSRLQSNDALAGQLSRIAFLVHQKNTDVFASCLWTWRLLAPMGAQGKKFISDALRDFRFKPEYGPSVFIGLALEEMPGIDTIKVKHIFDLLPWLDHQIRMQHQPNAAEAFQFSFKVEILDRLHLSKDEFKVKFAGLNTMQKGLLLGSKNCSAELDIKNWIERRGTSIRAIFERPTPPLSASSF